MKKILTLIALVSVLSACHITSKEPEVKDQETAYEAYGVLTIPTSGFTKENLRTKVILVDDELLDIYMFEVKFATMMPLTIDMVISNVSYTKSGSMIEFHGDSIVPTAGDKPYKEHIVTDLKGYISADSLCLTNNYGETPSVYAGKLVK